jgi:hypothetical protein
MILGESAFVYKAIPTLLSPTKGIKDLSFLKTQIFVSASFVKNEQFCEECDGQYRNAADSIYNELMTIPFSM